MAVSLDRLVRHCRGLATGEKPSDRCREGRHAEENEKEVRNGDVSERGDPPVQRVAPQPSDHADVTARHPEECSEKAEGSSRGGSQRAPRRTRCTRRGKRAKVARRLASHEAHRHAEHTEGDDDPEDRRPGNHSGRRGLVILRLDLELVGRRRMLGAADLGRGEGLRSLDQPVLVVAWMWNSCMACSVITVFGADVPLGRAPTSWMTGCARQFAAAVQPWLL